MIIFFKIFRYTLETMYNHIDKWYNEKTVYF